MIKNKIIETLKVVVFVICGTGVIFLTTLIFSFLSPELISNIRNALLNMNLSSKTVAQICRFLLYIPSFIGCFFGGMFIGLCIKRKAWIWSIFSVLIYLVYDYVEFFSVFSKTISEYSPSIFIERFFISLSFIGIAAFGAMVIQKGKRK